MSDYRTKAGEHAILLARQRNKLKDKIAELEAQLGEWKKRCAEMHLCALNALKDQGSASTLALRGYQEVAAKYSYGQLLNELDRRYQWANVQEASLQMGYKTETTNDDTEN